MATSLPEKLNSTLQVAMRSLKFPIIIGVLLKIRQNKDPSAKWRRFLEIKTTLFTKMLPSKRGKFDKGGKEGLKLRKYYSESWNGLW